MDINELRKQIDETDAEILRLFERRMSISGEIGAYKKQNGLSLFDASRERELLESRLSDIGDETLKPYAAQLFKTLMELSKGFQLRTVNEKNIVLIGIMGSGKSSKGKLLAERLGMGFIDIDEEIEKEQGMTVPEIFEKHGKFKFRDLENRKTAEISTLKHHVISTGGGVVLSDSNMENLGKNGIIVFLNRDIDETVRTIDTANRPLLADGAHKLYEIYNDRLELYRKWCDFELAGESTVEAAVDEIIKKIF